VPWLDEPLARGEGGMLRFKRFIAWFTRDLPVEPIDLNPVLAR